MIPTSAASPGERRVRNGPAAASPAWSPGEEGCLVARSERRAAAGGGDLAPLRPTHRSRHRRRVRADQRSADAVDWRCGFADERAGVGRAGVNVGG
jgi:hypothetical protein